MQIHAMIRNAVLFAETDLTVGFSIALKAPLFQSS
jgi:hypothetical protein